jgi:hypothetical protein
MKCAPILCIMFFACLCTRSQTIYPSVINSGGNYKYTEKYLFEWSIGEMPLVASINESGPFWITNGILQPHTSVKKDHRGPDFLPGTIIISPVPATNYIDINLFIRERGRLNIKITDVPGKIVYQSSKWYLGLDLTERIMISNLAKGTYIITFEMPGSFGYPAKKGSYEFIKL